MPEGDNAWNENLQLVRCSRRDPGLRGFSPKVRFDTSYALMDGSSMGNGNQDDHNPLPAVVAGCASGQFAGRIVESAAEHAFGGGLWLRAVNRLSTAFA
jgi:hypothetical protein